MPIERCVPERALLYTCLIVVLPTRLDRDWPQLAARVDSLLCRYRLIRPDGLKALLDGQVDWHLAGVIQVIGPRAIIDHPMLAESRQRICVRHPLSVDPVDVLRPYDRTSSVGVVDAVPVDPTMDGDARCLPTWRYLRTWGISGIRSVPALRIRVEDCREHFEDERYPALYRPVPGLEANRLSMILDNIPYQPTEIERKTYLENGARVWRYVLKELRKVEPRFARPNERTNTRDAQKDLRLFYAALCPLDEFLKLLPEPEWDTRFKDE